MGSWNSIPLEISYEIAGWIAFASWSMSFYLQVILNFRRKWYPYFFFYISKFFFNVATTNLYLFGFCQSVVGLSFDFVVLNLTKHSSYMIYNVCLYFSPFIQKQYFDTYGDKEMIPVAANDVAFSIHAVIMTTLLLFQICIYEPGSQKVSKLATAIVLVVWTFATICFFTALPTQSWLWLISIFNSIQVVMTCIKYTPQAKMNYTRKSTDGWSIENTLLDFTGGITTYLQMVIQSIDQNSWVNFYGNVGKTLLSFIVIFFDIIFMFQRYVLYPGKKASIFLETNQESNERLLDSSYEHI